jgi:hypothetical protein
MQIFTIQLTIAIANPHCRTAAKASEISGVNVQVGEQNVVGTLEEN